MKKLAIVYWTGTGNTENMANAVSEGFKEISDDVDIIFSDDFTADDMDDYEVIAFGCPAMGDEELEESSFEPMFTECESRLAGRKIAIFGSYEWNNGEWMTTWEQRCKDADADLVADPLPAYDDPNEEALESCRAMGRILAKC